MDRTGQQMSCFTKVRASFSTILKNKTKRKGERGIYKRENKREQKSHPYKRLQIGVQSRVWLQNLSDWERGRRLVQAYLILLFSTAFYGRGVTIDTRPNAASVQSFTRKGSKKEGRKEGEEREVYLLVLVGTADQIHRATTRHVTSRSPECIRGGAGVVDAKVSSGEHLPLFLNYFRNFLVFPLFSKIFPLRHYFVQWGFTHCCC